MRTQKKTNRKELDGAGIADSIFKSGFLGSLFVFNSKKAYDVLTAPRLFHIPSKDEEKSAKEKVAEWKREYEGDKRSGGYKGRYDNWILEHGYDTRSGPGIEQ